MGISLQNLCIEESLSNGEDQQLPTKDNTVMNKEQIKEEIDCDPEYNLTTLQSKVSKSMKVSFRVKDSENDRTIEKKNIYTPENISKPKTIKHATFDSKDCDKTKIENEMNKEHKDIKTSEHESKSKKNIRS